MKRLQIAALVAALIALPSVGFAQSKTAQSKAAPKSAPAAHTTTVMTGIVKSVGDTSLVINHSNAKGPEVTFQLNASTERKGTLSAGEAVSVRYFVDKATKVATVVTVKSAKKDGK